MANITKKPNGTYMVRISCGLDMVTGRQILRGRTFRPSKPNLSQKRLNAELNEFIEELEAELQSECNRKKPKSHSGFRTISIPNCLCNTLLEYKAIQDTTMPSEYVFTTKDGDVMNPHTPTKQFSKFLDRHGIRHLKFHCLRHTSATILLANGCDIKTVSARLGHSDTETTNIYIHVLKDIEKNTSLIFDNFILKK